MTTSAQVVLGILVAAATIGAFGAPAATPVVRGALAGAQGQAAVAVDDQPPVPADPNAPAVIPTPLRNQPDAFVMAAKSRYFLYSSQVSVYTPPIMVSSAKTVLGQWSTPRSAMTSDPPWARFGFTWGPDVRRVGRRFVLYYDALSRITYVSGAGRQCIGTAVSRSALGPFQPAATPLVCQPDHHGSIDPRSFVGKNGRLWLVWKSDDNADFTSSSDVTHIFAQRLDRTGQKLIGKRFELLAADEAWQHNIIEAPDLVHAAGGYWLFYSGGWFNQPYYAIGVARCVDVIGPCTDLPTNPWLASNTQGQGPGEESLFRDRSGRWWLVYTPTAWGLDGNPVRPVALARVDFTRSGPELVKVG
jgi:beta-xylosidase